VTVRLESLRDRLLRPYRRVAMALLPSPRLWEIWTNREILHHGARRTDPRGLSELTQRVEEGFYSGQSPTAEHVEAVREEADRVYSELIHEGPPRPGSTGENGEPTAR
jgi:hypothetical protein